MEESGALGAAALLALQGRAKRDPEGYRDEVERQRQHFAALLGLLELKPAGEHREFQDLVAFLAQLAAVYPKDSVPLPGELMSLLDKHATVLNAALRRALVQALILLRNRGTVETAALLPLFFRLFRCHDKALRTMLFRFIVNDLRLANKKRTDERLNRHVQGFLHGVLADEHEVSAKKSLAVLTELYRRNVWTDTRTVNLVASAVLHPSPRVMVAALKFFLGQDEKENEDGDEDESDDSDDDEDDGGDKAARAGSVAVDRQQVYAAYKKGVASSKKKKQAKLKRAVQALKKKSKKEESTGSGNARFAALQLINDPQGFAERVFGRLQSTGERFETKLLLMQIISRVVGIHKLQVLNFYPFLQRYIQPQQRDATHLLAAAAQACHDLVPPDAIEGLVRQLVNQFVHDRARPDVIAVGLHTMREICVRCPLVMTEDLLRDLTLYKKHKDKAVAAAGRAMIQLFRELAPALLEKKDRGKGADLEARVQQYGELHAADRIAGAELLQRVIETGEGLDDEDDEDDSDGLVLGSEIEVSDPDAASGDEEDDDEAESGEDDDEAESGDEDVDEEEEDDDEEDDEEASEEEQDDDGGKSKGSKGSQIAPKADSLAAMRKKLKAAEAAKTEAGASGSGGADGGEGDTGVLEQDRFLTPDDFKRIKALQAKRKLDATLERFGAKKAARIANETMGQAVARDATLHERRIDPRSLQGVHKYRLDKAERLASVYAGREGREFGAAAGRRKKKQETGASLSNREKEKRKNLPTAARLSKARRRTRDQKGHFKRKKGAKG